MSNPVISRIARRYLEKQANFDAGTIGDKVKGPLAKDADESYLNGEFTQQEYDELRGLQESGSLAKGVRPVDERGTNPAIPRNQLKKATIKLAYENPHLRPYLLPILKEAASWDPSQIGREVPGGYGKLPGEWTQEEFSAMEDTFGR